MNEMSPSRSTPGPTDSQAMLRVAWAATAMRIGFGLLWAVDAWLKWQPGFFDGYLGYVTDAARDQPAFLASWFRLWTDLVSISPAAFAFATALLETGLALCLVLGVARRPVYVVGAIFSLLIWSTAQGFGGPYTQGSTDPGAGIPYALLFATLFVLDAAVGGTRLSLDARIGRLLPRWDRLARPAI